MAVAASAVIPDPAVAAEEDSLDWVPQAAPVEYVTYVWCVTTNTRAEAVRDADQKCKGQTFD